MKTFCFYATAALAGLVLTAAAFAHEHTHIGRNHDGIWGNADDNQLWIFAEPAQPQWGTIKMLPTGEFLAGSEIYAAELDCWHSAHPASGVYQFGGSDINQQPNWQIALGRVGFSSNSFWMEREDTGEEILTADGQKFAFNLIWMADQYNENGTLGAWGLHSHTEFLALADGPGETFTASFRAVDLGSTGYQTSDVFTMTFQTIPEPASVILLGLGALSILKRRR